MHRTMATSCESLSVEGFCFLFFPSPRHIQRPSHPNLFLLGFKLKLMPSRFSISQAMGQAKARAGQVAEFWPGPALQAPKSLFSARWKFPKALDGPMGSCPGKGLECILVPGRTCSDAGCDVGARVPMAVERRAYWSAFRDQLRQA